MLRPIIAATVLVHPCYRNCCCWSFNM